jgi:BirA family biotin operon repressor/biotin-[acetyl-CoA-carboxylase] ligase
MESGRMTLESLALASPFAAPVYYLETAASTMEEARALAGNGAGHGTAVTAGCQRAGRGRGGRVWVMNAGESLPFTVILRYADAAAIPPCLTLRAGLAAARAIESFAGGALDGKVLVKWPNDVMLLWKDGTARKTAGILTEASGGTVFLGVGINAAQREFPPELERKAGSIAGALVSYGADADAAAVTRRRFSLLEGILAELYAGLETTKGAAWREELEARLYMRGKTVRFVPGAPTDPADAGGGGEITGTLEGVAESGEIRIRPEGGQILSFITGELRVYGQAHHPSP